MNKRISIVILGLACAMGAQAASINWVSLGTNTEWNLVDNWETDYLPGDNTNGVPDRADFFQGSDVATVTSAVTSSNKVDILMRNNGNLTISADMPDLRLIDVGINGAIAGFGTFIKQDAGTVTARDLTLGTDDANGGLYELSGSGALALTGFTVIGANGKVSMMGSNAAFAAGNGTNDNLTMLSTGILDFQFDAAGVGSIDVADAFIVDSTNSVLTIDALAYEGAAATFDLVTFSTNIGTFATSNITVSGVKSWSVGYDADSMFVSLVPYGPGDTLLIGQDDFDGAALYADRTIVGGANSAGGITWAVVSRDNIQYPGMIDTSVAAGGVVTQDVTDVSGFLGTNKTDNIFGLYRAGAAGGGRSLTYTFDITGYTNLNLLVDWATSGAYQESKDVSMSYVIDGGATNTILDIGVSPDDWTETMDNGTELTRTFSFPVTVNGVVTNSLTDEFQTYNPQIDGMGTNLTLIIVMESGVGGFGGMGMDNLKLYGTIPGTPGLPEIGDMTIEVISGGTEVSLSWLTDVGYTYGVQSKADLNDLVWDNIITNVPGTGFEVTVTNALSPDVEFYQAYIEE